MMQIIRLTIIGIVLSSGAAYAQMDSAGTTTGETRNERSFDPGWFGLIGLAGLAGLMPKKDHRADLRGTTAAAR